MSERELQEASDRLWQAAEALDELRGDRKASDWTAERVADLLDQDRAGDPAAVLPIARTLEKRLRRERALRRDEPEDAPDQGDNRGTS